MWEVGCGRTHIRLRGDFMARERKESTGLAVLTWSGADVSDPPHPSRDHIRDDDPIVLALVADEHPAVGEFPN